MPQPGAPKAPPQGYLHPDPAAVGAWCRAQLSPGAVYVAPGAAARRLALRSIAASGKTTLGVAFTSRANLVSFLETKAGLPAPKLLPPTLERLLVAESARAAKVPLFEETDRAPRGAIDALARLVRDLRANALSADAYAEAGGDPRAADAVRRFEQRRTALGFSDAADRVARLVSHGVARLPVVIEEPAINDLLGLDLYRAIAADAAALHLGLADLSGATGADSLVGRLRAIGVDIDVAGAAVGTPNVSAIGGAGMYDEVELVARRILALLRSSAGVRPSDVLAVAPSSRYLTLLHGALGALGVPVASPRRLPTLDVPVVDALISAMTMLANPEEDTPANALVLLASPCVGLGLRRHDRLTRQMVRRGRGAMRSWATFAADESPGAFRRLAEAVPALAESLKKRATPHDFAAVLSRLALDFGFLSSGRRANLAAGRDDAVRADQQGWDTLVEVMEEVGDSLRAAGVARLDARAWLAELREALADREVRVEAKAVDGVHATVAGAGMPCAPHVFALGWREGLVPRRVREDPLLPDRVKRALNASGAMLRLAGDRVEQERDRRERIVRSARQSLVISWPATGDEGEAVLPSFYMEDLGLERARAEVRAIGETTWPTSLAATRGERMARVTVLAKHRPATALGEELDAVRRALGGLTEGERAAFDAGRCAGEKVKIGPGFRAKLVPLAKRMSASQARMLAHCAFEHFGRKRLALQALVPPALDLPTIGAIIHGVLASIGRAGWDAARVDALFAKEWEARIGAGLDADAAEPLQRELVLAQLRELVAGEAEVFTASEARPAHFELAFGMPEEDAEARDGESIREPIELRLRDGAPIPTTMLRGSIDRVDLVVRDGKRYGVAIDYKSGKGESYMKETDDLADFQLPIYCEALRAFGIEPVGALYVGVASGERHGVVRDEFADAYGVREMKTVRKPVAADFDVYMAARIDALREHVATLARGEIEVRPRKGDCKYCDLRPVCRIGTFGVGGANGEE